MPIYTKKGDKGRTSLFGGKKVYKDSTQVSAYGEIDEVSSYVGLLIALHTTNSDKKILTDIQRVLYIIMGTLAGSSLKSTTSVNKQTRIIEREIDRMDSVLPQLHRFILPQGTVESSHFQIARSICRRGERSLVTYFKDDKDTNKNKTNILAFINRLSDYLFVMARWYNKDVPEIST